MADYISRERLLRDPYIREGRYSCSDLIRMAINEQPTADVVPRSEVERLEKELAKCYEQIDKSTDFYCSFTKNKIQNCPIQDEVEKAKQEVSREILQIIDGITGAEYDNHNEIEVAFMRGAKKIRNKIVQKYNITEQPITEDKRNA